MILKAGTVCIVIIDFLTDFIRFGAVHLPERLLRVTEPVAEGLGKSVALFKVSHTCSGTSTCSLDSTAISILTRILCLKRVKSLVCTTLKTMFASHLIKLSPLHFMTGKSNLHGLVHGNGLACTMLHTLLAAVADMTFVDRIRFELGIGKEYHKTHTRTELRSQEHL